ncbi:MAG: tetratricopeptide repeat protein [Myxococcota bacterium]
MPALRGRRALGLLLAVALACGACSTDPERRDGHLAEAEAYLAEGKIDEALLELRSALRIDPQNAEINLQIARVLLGSGDAAGALFFFREARRLDPSRNDAAVEEAGILFLEDPDAADQLLDAVLAAEPANAAAMIVRSKAAVLRGDVDAALRAALTAVEFAPDDPVAHQQVGKIHQARIRTAQLAEESVDDALYEASLAAFQRAHDLSPEGLRVIGLQNRAEVFAAWPGHLEEAKQAYRDAISEASKGTASGALRQSLRAALVFGARARDREFRVEVLSALVEIEPTGLNYWFLLAELERVGGGSADAVLDRMLEALPDSVPANVRYAVYLIENEREDEGFAHLEAKANEGVDPPLLLSTLASRLLDRRKTVEAAAVVERLRDEYPGTFHADLAESRLAFDEGRLEEAAKILRVLVSREQDPGAWQLLAQAEFRLGNLPEALEATGAALELARALGASLPERTLRLQAHVQVAAHDYEGALRSFRILEREGAEMATRDLVLHARALYGLGRSRSARRTLQPLLGDPPKPAAVMEVAEREFVENPQAVGLLLAEALQARPKHPGLLLWAARLHLAQGNPGRAREQIRQAMAAGVLTPALLMERSRALAVTGNLEQAQRDALQAFEADPQLPGAINLLMALFASSGQEKAIESFEEADTVGALGPTARYLLARLHQASGDHERGLEILEELADQPDLPAAKNDLAYTLAEQGVELARAQALAEEAARALGGRPEAAHTLGYVYLRQGLHGPALEQFRFALQTAPKPGDPLVHYHFGLALQGLGRVEEAEQAFGEALALDAELVEAEKALEDLRAATPTDAADSS